MIPLLTRRKGVYFTLLTLGFILVLVLLIAIIAQQGFYSAESQSAASRARSMNALAISIDKDLERAVYISGFRALVGLNDWIRNASDYNGQPEYVPPGELQWYMRHIMTTGHVPVVDLSSPPTTQEHPEQIAYPGVWSGIDEYSKYTLVFSKTPSGSINEKIAQTSSAMNEGNEPSTLPAWVERIQDKSRLAGAEVHINVKSVSGNAPHAKIIDEAGGQPITIDDCGTNELCKNILRPYDITISQTAYEYVIITITYDLNITDNQGTASIQFKDKQLSTRIPIINLPDPLYSGYSGGKLQNTIQRFALDGEYLYEDLSVCGAGDDCLQVNITKLKAYLSGPNGHSYYRPYPKAPSLLQRFHGTTEASTDSLLNPTGALGVESIVNLYTAAQAGMTLLNKPSVDWMYFSKTVTPGQQRNPATCPDPNDPQSSGCAIDSNPSSFAVNTQIAYAEGQNGFEQEAQWFKIDCCALQRYNFIDTNERIAFYKYFSNYDNPTDEAPNEENTPGSIQDGIVINGQEVLNQFCNMDEASCPALPLPPPGHPESFQCNDRKDNDGNGLIDLNDPGCTDPYDSFEGPDCADGEDNDGDGGIDMGMQGTGGYPADSGCTDENDPSELEECSDGLDNDGNGLIDINDPGCWDGEWEQGVPATLSEGIYSPHDNSEANTLPECSDYFDNDNDGTIDYDGHTIGDTVYGADADCEDADDTSESPLPPVCGNQVLEEGEGCEYNQFGIFTNYLCDLPPNSCSYNTHTARWIYYTYSWNEGVACYANCTCATAKQTQTTCNSGQSCDLYYGCYTPNHGGGCYGEDSLILMADGNTKKISEINIGDFVRSYNKATGEYTTAIAESLREHEVTEYRIINGIVVTKNHPILVDGEFIPAGHAILGMKMGKTDDQNAPAITSIQDRNGLIKVYDLQVSAPDTFIVVSPTSVLSRPVTIEGMGSITGRIVVDAPLSGHPTIGEEEWMIGQEKETIPTYVPEDPWW